MAYTIVSLKCKMKTFITSTIFKFIEYLFFTLRPIPLVIY